MFHLFFFASVTAAAAAFLASSSERLFFCIGSPHPVPATNSASTTETTDTETALPLIVLLPFRIFTTCHWMPGGRDGGYCCLYPDRWARDVDERAGTWGPSSDQRFGFG